VAQVVIADALLGAGVRRLVTWGVYLAFQGTPAAGYSTFHRDLERSEHISDQTKLWLSQPGARHRAVE